MRATTMVGLCMAMSLVSCGSRDEKPAAVQPVVAAKVAAGAVSDSTSLPGEIAARHTTTLSFRTGGKILEQHAQLGDHVRAGEILARLELADLRANEATAQARLRAAQQHFEATSNQFERDQVQAEKKLISAAELDRSGDAYATALAQRDDAGAQLSVASTRLSDGDLSAVRDGFITAKLTEAGQNVAAGQPVYELAWSDGLDASCEVPETWITQVKPNDPATVTVTALPGVALAARVREVATAADPQTQTWKIRLSINQPPASLRPGMAAVAKLAPSREGTTSTPALFSLPATALFHDAAIPAVWVVAPHDSTLELRHVVIARYEAQTVDIASGLHDGDVVVLQGAHAVHAGQKVRVVAPRVAGGDSR